MTLLRNEEQLEVRAGGLAAKGLNAFRLAYVTLDPSAQPAFAWLDVEFWSDVALTPLPPATAFAVLGVARARGGNAAVAIAVTDVLPGSSANTLRLKLAPVGDYSTYVLSTTAANLGAPGNALPLAMDPLLNRLPFKFRPGCFNLNCTPATPQPPPPVEPAIDYLARDYDSFRHVLMTAMARRVPGWAPTSEADLDQVLIDLIAADADEQADYHDRVLAERSITTARKRVSLARHARLMDYHIHQGNQASTWLALALDGSAGPVSVDLPASANDEFGVWTGRDWKADEAVHFAMPRGANAWRRRCHSRLDALQLYTWGQAITALAAGSTEADLTVAGGLSSAAEAVALCQLFLGLDPAQQLPAGSDVVASVDRLLIQEVLNPATGAANGARLSQRQLLRLIPADSTNPPRAEVVADPVSGQWLVRVRWLAEDALRSTFCFICDCSGTVHENVSLFHGNLVPVTQGQPRITTFVAPGQPLPPLDESGFVICDGMRYERVYRQQGPTSPLRGVLCPLPATPLAWQATATGGGAPTRSSAEVTVSGYATPWTEQSDLIESRGSDEHYIVEVDELGGASLRFGDGVNGAALPDGAVVRCRHRIGQGTAGNVGADSLVGYTDVGAGVITRVWNPFDVVDGRDPEPVAEIIRNVPEAYRARQLRAVTLDDYARRAEELPGVSHARAHYAWTGSWRTVRVAIDPAGTTVLSEALRTQVVRTLEAVRLIGEDLEVRPATYVPLDITMTLCAEAAYWPEDLRAVLDEEFSDGWTRDGRRGLFHPDSWTFGQPLYASQLIGRALAVTGVGRVLRLSIRRFHPGSGFGAAVIDIDPAALPERYVDALAVGPFEIVVVANDPDHLETGRIRFQISGGRR